MTNRMFDMLMRPKHAGLAAKLRQIGCTEGAVAATGRRVRRA